VSYDSALGSAINAGQKVSSATKSQDGRASALWGIAAGRDAYDAAKGAGDAMKSLAGGSGPLGTAVTLSLGTSKSKSTLTQDRTSHTGSKANAVARPLAIWISSAPVSPPRKWAWRAKARSVSPPPPTPTRHAPLISRAAAASVCPMAPGASAYPYWDRRARSTAIPLAPPWKYMKIVKPLRLPPKI